MKQRPLNIAIILAAGTGTGERMEHSSKPKQFLEFQDKPVSAYTLKHFQRHPGINGIGLENQPCIGLHADPAAGFPVRHRCAGV